MAEGEGFEPPLGFPLKRFSRPPVSTTHTTLRAGGVLPFDCMQNSPIWASGGAGGNSSCCGCQVSSPCLRTGGAWRTTCARPRALGTGYLFPCLAQRQGHTWGTNISHANKGAYCASRLKRGSLHAGRQIIKLMTDQKSKDTAYTTRSGISSCCLRKARENASTTSGSNSLPAPRSMMSRASNGVLPLR